MSVYSFLQFIPPLNPALSTAGRLAKEGTIPVVLSSLSSVARLPWCSDPLLLRYHSLILKLAHKGTVDSLSLHVHPLQCSGLPPVSM